MQKVFLTILISCFFQSVFANYRVEIAVFEKSVPSDYFHNIDNVQLAIDVNELYRYYLGDFSSMEAAADVLKDVISKGYKYARIIDLKIERQNCAMSCKDPLYVQNIFFDFDRSRLRTKSRKDLDALAILLKDNPEYKVELSAHTDSYGTLEYNTALSTRRSNAAKDYLINQGINASRIMTSEFGESSPIAKNAVNGKDSPDGRQFNRRVVVTVIDGDGKIVSNVVKPIDIPETLKIN